MSQLFNPTSATASSVPVGAIVMWPTATPPADWLVLDGSSFSALTYPDLNTLLGGTTLPDARQRFPLGLAISGTGSTLLGTGGAVDHTHTQPTHTHTGPSHVHSVDPPTTTSGGPSATSPTNLVIGATASDTHTHDVNIPAFDSAAGGTGNTGASGSDSTGTNNPPFLSLNFIIKAA